MTLVVSRGNSPSALGLPHTGAFVPDEIRAWMDPRGRKVADTDWHIQIPFDQPLTETTTGRATLAAPPRVHLTSTLTQLADLAPTLKGTS